MITDAILSALLWVAKHTITLFPEVTEPAWVTSLVATITSGVAPVMGLGYWVPLGALGTVATFILILWGVALAIRGIRILVSAFTGGGGSAA